MWPGRIISITAKVVEDYILLDSQEPDENYHEYILMYHHALAEEVAEDVAGIVQKKAPVTPVENKNGRLQKQAAVFVFNGRGREI